MTGRISIRVVQAIRAITFLGGRQARIAPTGVFQLIILFLFICSGCYSSDPNEAFSSISFSQKYTLKKTGMTLGLPKEFELKSELNEGSLVIFHRPIFSKDRFIKLTIHVSPVPEATPEESMYELSLRQEKNRIESKQVKGLSIQNALGYSVYRSIPAKPEDKWMIQAHVWTKKMFTQFLFEGEYRDMELILDEIEAMVGSIKVPSGE